ncbi:unnamed protein product, partial [Amoebophrya sp. A25]
EELRQRLKLPEFSMSEPEAQKVYMIASLVSELESDLRQREEQSSAIAKTSQNHVVGAAHAQTQTHSPATTGPGGLYDDVLARLEKQTQEAEERASLIRWLLTAVLTMLRTQRGGPEA